MCELTEAASKLYNLLLTRDFDYNAFEAELKTGKYSADDVSMAAYQYVDDSSMDTPDEFIERPLGEVLPNLYSSHMYEALKLMLDYGLDPNRIFHDKDHPDEEENILVSLSFVDNGYVGVDCLALLLEHGGNPCMKIKGYALVDETYFDMGFWFINAEGPWERESYDIDAHFFMVLAAYGGHFDDGQGMIDMRKGHDVSELKEHRNYYYGGIDSDRSNDHYEICLFDKKTNYEVGRY